MKHQEEADRKRRYPRKKKKRLNKNPWGRAAISTMRMGNALRKVIRKQILQSK